MILRLGKHKKENSTFNCSLVVSHRTLFKGYYRNDPHLCVHASHLPSLCFLPFPPLPLPLPSRVRTIVLSAIVSGDSQQYWKLSLSAIVCPIVFAIVFAIAEWVRSQLEHVSNKQLLFEYSFGEHGKQVRCGHCSDSR